MYRSVCIYILWYNRMKWTATLAVAILLTIVFGLPFRQYDTHKLLPIKTLQVISEAGQVRLISEVGEGKGRSFEEAVEDLRRNAPGDVFFDTAEQILFGLGAPMKEVVESGLLRPSAKVYYINTPKDPAGLGEWLGAHPTELTLAQLRAEAAARHR